MTILAMANDATKLVEGLEQLAEEYAAAFTTETELRRMLKEAEQDLASAESELIAEAAVEARVEKTGVLAGVAATSKAYPAAIESLLAAERNDGMLTDIAADVRKLRQQADSATIEREAAAARFSAAKYAANLQAAILNALA